MKSIKEARRELLKLHEFFFISRLTSSVIYSQFGIIRMILNFQLGFAIALSFKQTFNGEESLARICLLCVLYVAR